MSWFKPRPIVGHFEINPRIVVSQDSKDPERIRVFIHWDGFTDHKGERPGMQIVFSSNPKSADYNPNNFNRCMRILEKQAGELKGSNTVPIHSRLLRLRDRWIREYLAS